MRPNPHSSDLGQPDTTQYSKTQCLPSNSVVTKPRGLTSSECPYHGAFSTAHDLLVTNLAHQGSLSHYRCTVPETLSISKPSKRVSHVGRLQRICGTRFGRRCGCLSLWSDVANE